MLRVKKSWTLDICYPGEERLAPLEKKNLQSCVVRCPNKQMRQTNKFIFIVYKFYLVCISLGKANAEREKSWTSDICYPGDERLAPLEKRNLQSCVVRCPNEQIKQTNKQVNFHCL
jgi:hypothetical protein